MAGFHKGSLGHLGTRGNRLGGARLSTRKLTLDKASSPSGSPHSLPGLQRFSFSGLPGSWFSLALNSGLSYPPPKPDAAGFVDFRSARGLYHRGSGRPAAPPPPTPPPISFQAFLESSLSFLPRTHRKAIQISETAENPPGLKTSPVCPPHRTFDPDKAGESARPPLLG